MPITSVFGSVEREKIVIIHSRQPFLVKLVQKNRTTSMMIFCRVSAAMKRKFISYGLFVDMKWKDKRGTAKMATKRLMPEHWSGEKIFHQRTEP